jgi:RNA recognition motif-containing protein
MKFGKRSKGFGFVTFSSPNEALKAVSDLHENELLGRTIQVRHSKPREPAAPKEPSDLKKVQKEKVQKEKVQKEKTPKEKEVKDVKPKKKEKDSPVENVAKPKKSSKPVNRIDTSLNTSMYVANLPFKVRDADLFSIFKDYSVKNAYVVKRFGRSRGFGFVEFESTAERDKVLGEVFNAIVNDRVIVMKPAMANVEEEIAE